MRRGRRTVSMRGDGVSNGNGPRRGETKRAMLESGRENPADANYVRRNSMTKGAVVQTDLGSVRITSRPGRAGVLNGVLLDE